MNTCIAIFLAPGFEEIEALAPVDIFRRAGEHVCLCAVNDEKELTVVGSHGIPVICDTHIDQLKPEEIFLGYCPGGMPGAANLAKDSRVLSILQTIQKNGGFCCAICASPIVLDAAGLLASDTEYTCYPGFEQHIQHGKFTDNFIQRSGKLLTACGPGASMDFAMEILRAIGKTAIVTTLASGMQMRRK